MIVTTVDDGDGTTSAGTAAPVTVAVQNEVPGGLAITVATGGSAASGGASAQSYALAAASSWTHTHSFSYFPDVRLVANFGAGNVAAEIDVEYPAADQVHLSFPSPFTGTVIIS